MPSGDDQTKKTRLIEFIIRTLNEHEKEMDRITDTLQAAKTNFIVAAKTLDGRLDKILLQVDFLQAQIEQLKKQIL
jgi:hypothetical protein